MNYFHRLLFRIGYKTNVERPDPTTQDLMNWEQAENDLIDHLYTGITGLFQRMGHYKIHCLTKKYKYLKVLEIGCGHAHHLDYSKHKYGDYTGLDINKTFLAEAKIRHPNIKTVLADATKMPFANNSFDIIISIYNLEHIKNLNELLVEVKRVLKNNGRFLVAIPMEGGFLYNMGREFSSKPYMQKKYMLNYDAIIKYEHCNEIWDILEELRKHFIVNKKTYLPFLFPTIHLNIISVFELINQKSGGNKNGL